MRVVCKCWLRALLLTSAYLLGTLGIVASGGGSGGAGDIEEFSIVQPVSPTLETTITLEVSVSVTINEPNSEYFVPFNFDWKNETTGESGTGGGAVSRTCSFPPPFFLPVCSGGSTAIVPVQIPLAVGSNEITIEVEGEKKSVHIVRIDDTIPPRMPTGVSVQTTENGAIVSWVHLIEATSYNIYFASSPGVTKSNYLALPDGAKITDASFPHSITGLTTGTVYYFVVTAVNAPGESEESTEVMTSAPGVPSGVSVQGMDEGAVISWSPTVDAVTYNIYYASSPGVAKSNYTILPDGGKIVGALSPESITGLTNGTVYYFVVTAVNSLGESEESTEVRPSLPSPPTGISAQPISLGVTISWDPIMVGASYNIYYASSPGITKSNYSTLPNGNKFSGASSPQPLIVSTHEDYFFVITSTNTGGESVESVEVMAPPGPSLSFDIKTFRFDWLQVSNATHYKLLENPDGISGFSQVGSDIPQGTYTFDHIVALFNRINASYILQSCVGANCDDFGILNITDNLVDAIGYFGASNASSYDDFGSSVSLSADGSTLAVGARTQADDGAVYVFTHNSGNWNQQAFIKASNSDFADSFGESVSLSNDGNTLAIGAYGEDSNANGINGNQADNSASDSGAVYVFTRSGSDWSQQAYVKASNTDPSDYFGESVSLSNDGNTLAVGARGEAGLSGAVYVFTRSGSNWSQQAYVKASNTDSYDLFGESVSLGDDGNTLAVGAHSENSGAFGINGNEADNSANNSGAAYVFTRSGSDWSQQAYVKASNTDSNDFFGESVVLSDDGNTLAVGAPREDSSTSGIDSAPDELAINAGAVYVFTRSGSDWNQQAYIKASNTDPSDYFGESVSLGDDGNTLAVGAREDSSASGINGNQADNSASNSGAVYVFTRNGSNWSQQAYVKASKTDPSDIFGESVSLSDDGDTLAVGARGVGTRSGAVYLY